MSVKIGVFPYGDHCFRMSGAEAEKLTARLFVGETGKTEPGALA
jgi:hypothetical protein